MIFYSILRKIKIISTIIRKMKIKPISKLTLINKFMKNN